MLQLLDPLKARDLLVRFIASLEGEGVLSRRTDDVMLGCLVARAPGGQICQAYAFSGALHGSYIHERFVPPCFSVHGFEGIVDEYDSRIHCYSDRIERGEKDLERTRSALSNECLERIRSLYTFYTPNGKIGFNDMGIQSMPTGTGDCATVKLISYCFRRGWEPLSLCEMYYGDGSTRYHHLQECTPCDEKCALVLPHILRIPVIYSDDSIVVVDKPAGMLSVPGRGEDKQDCATARVKAVFPSIPDNPSVHRLDMDTSGVLVMAKDDAAKSSISRQFELRQTRKEYIALVEGVVRQDEGTIDLPLRLDVDDRPRQIVDEEHGKKAVTRFERIAVEIVDGRPVTRIRFAPLTGRTHQIRVHAAYGLGHPVVGDRLYGERLPGQRLCLHAGTLEFTHPATGTRVSFSSPCPF